MNTIEILEAIKDAGAKDWQGVVNVLEDGETLAALGITDNDQNAIEDLHAYAEAMVAGGVELIA